MSELRLPLDVEQLTETCQLRAALRVLRTANLAGASINLREIEALTSFLFLRLFIVLGYLARSTNKPGRLTAAGAVQLRESLEPLFGDNCDPVKLLAEAGLLVAAESEWACPLFTRLNDHLAGDYRPKHLKGNDMRQVSIAISHATVTSPHQMKLLIPEMCVRPDGSRLVGEELDRVMMLIGTLDRIFKFTRQRTQLTDVLLNASARACLHAGYKEKAVSEELREFLGWLIRHRDNPRVPGTTEQLLQEFEVIWAMAKAN